jgi:hypothetical protein
MSDEADFHLSGHVNRQNFHYHCQENPSEMQGSSLHSVKATSSTTI